MKLGAYFKKFQGQKCQLKFNADDSTAYIVFNREAGFNKSTIFAVHDDFIVIDGFPNNTRNIIPLAKVIIRGPAEFLR